MIDLEKMKQLNEKEIAFLSWMEEKSKKYQAFTTEDILYLQDYFLKDFEININIQNPSTNYTVLMYACLAGQLQVIKLLIELRPEIDLNQLNSNYIRALDISYGLCDAEICDYLESKGAKGAHLEGIILAYC